MRSVYLDHSATTPVDARVLDVMLPYFGDVYGNASSIHGAGRRARQALDGAREHIAQALHANDNEIVFTSGGTESDNLALLGVAEAFRHKGRHFISAGTEHHAVLKTLEWLETQGNQVTYLPVDACGVVEPEAVREALQPDTICVSLMAANNETGTLTDLTQIGAITREAGVLFHSDIVQSFGKLPLDVTRTPVDILSMSGHKIYGPKGIGALYVRRGVRLSPYTHGGSHERGRRPGTENVAGAVGMGRAVEICVEVREAESTRIRQLRDYFWTALQEKTPGARLNGHPEHRLPGHLNVSYEGVEGESLLLSLDLAGVSASSGSACEAGSIEPSHVLTAMGLPPELAQAALRFTLGRFTTKDDIDYTVSAMPDILERLRELSAV